jgi:hypothetical protein
MTDVSRRRVCLGLAALTGAPALSGCTLGAPETLSIAPPATREPPAFTGPPDARLFPLRVRPGTRWLEDASGRPFFVQGDSPWSLPVQLTRAQALTYLDDRARRGFSAIMFEAMEHEFSSQSPPWLTVDGAVPFASGDAYDPRVDAYWRKIDFLVEEANRRGIACFLHPAYLGYEGGSQGWTTEVLAASPDVLHAYGRWLARRYAGRGVVWVLGGDYAGAMHPGLLERQWQIARGIRAVDVAAVVTAHGPRGDSAYAAWHGFDGLTLNNIYTGGTEHVLAAREYARSGPMPFVLIEGWYDGDRATPADCRRQAWVAVLGGACGHFFGNQPLWGFGEPNANGGLGAAHALATALDTPATRQVALVKSLLDSLPWWQLVPAPDGSLVTSPRGAGRDFVAAAATPDRSLALVWTPGRAFDLDPAYLAAGMRARWYDTSTGVLDAALPVARAGTATPTFDPGRERVLVLDRAAAA